MKAIQYAAFGDSGVIQIGQVNKPVPKENEVLIKVAAVSVNPFDMKIRSGAFQSIMPVVLPFVPGTDVAGTVEAIGSNVSRLQVGDEVFATTNGGTYAEYALIAEQQVEVKPQNVTLQEAAALAVAVVTAYTFLVEHGQVKEGQKVLIHGAAGGVGTVMVQMAKALGAYVIGTASNEGISIAQSLGADEVIDYKHQDFTALVKDADLVVDLVGGETQKRSYGVIKKGGKLLSAVMPPSAELAQQYQVTANFLNSTPSYKKLAFGKALVEQGKIKTRIAVTLKLEDAARAQDMISAGGVNGKIVLEVA